MTKSELVGYVRKSNSGNALKLNILKSALENAETVEGKDGTEYVQLIMNLSKIKMIIGDEHEATSVCQLTEDDGTDPVHVDAAKSVDPGSSEENEDQDVEEITEENGGKKPSKVQNADTGETGNIMGVTDSGVTVDVDGGGVTWWAADKVIGA